LSIKENTRVTPARIETPFGAQTTATEVLRGVDLSGKRAIVTGGGSGIGAETAKALAGAGAEVVLAVRDTAAGMTVAAEIVAATGNRGVTVAPLDLTDQSSVRKFVAAWDGPLHILVNNAGIMANPEQRTVEGWEYQFATNHLGHFALSFGLHSALADARGARIVAVSSVGHVNADIDFTDLMFVDRPYDAFQAYGQSKTANALFAVEAARRWADDSITANALNPGRIVTTKLMRYISEPAAGPASFGPTSTDVSYKNTEQGAATSALLAGSPLVEGVTGLYFEDCQQAVAYVPGVRRGVASWAIDPVRAEKLWNVSLELIGPLG
jgi:NAD(P)-dependent dehydrogenase (short-subunit alcohol dehydrogenase family)